MPEEDGYQHLDNVQRPPTAPTYDYDGAVLSNMGGMGRIKLDIGRPVHCMSNKFDRTHIS